MVGDGAPQGTYTAHGVGHAWGMFEPGRRYRVIRAFPDFDNDQHPVGEEWTYLGTAFLPYDDGRSIFVSADGAREWHIRMQDRAEAQRDILDNLASYIAEVKAG